MFRLRKVMIWREFVGLGKQGDKAAARGLYLGLAAGVPTPILGVGLVMGHGFNTFALDVKLRTYTLQPDRTCIMCSNKLETSVPPF